MKKSIIGTGIIIAVCSLGSIVFIQQIKAMNYAKKEMIPTSYAENQQLSSNLINQVNEEFSYTIQETKPEDEQTIQTITKEEASKIAVTAIQTLFQDEIGNKTIDITYIPKKESGVRDLWHGEIIISDDKTYLFEVDATTGELFSVRTEHVFEDVKITGMDKALLDNYDQYVQLTKDLVENYEIITGDQISFEYESQGAFSSEYGANIDITIKAISNNGQEANITFSRYNQKLVGVQYDGAVKEYKRLEEQLAEEIEQSSDFWLTEDELEDDLQEYDIDQQEEERLKQEADETMGNFELRKEEIELRDDMEINEQQEEELKRQAEKKWAEQESSYVIEK